MKTIGVLGGMGPQATMDFEQRVHRAAQELIPRRAAMGYPPMVVYYHREPPFIADDRLMPILPMRPNPKLLEAARQIGGMCDFLVITSNSPHVFKEAIEKAAGREILSIIDVTLAELKKRRCKRVGVLGMGKPVVHLDVLAKHGIASEFIDSKSDREGLNAEIFKVMEGRTDAGSTSVAHEQVADLRSRGVDAIILGCTEIPLLLPDWESERDLINPLALLAEAAVRYAIHNQPM